MGEKARERGERGRSGKGISDGRREEGKGQRQRVKGERAEPDEPVEVARHRGGERECEARHAWRQLATQHRDEA